MTRLATQLLATSRGHVPFDLTAELNGKLSSPELREFIRKHADEVDVHGLHFANGVLDGPLNLQAMDVRFPLTFTNCSFSDALELDGARLHSLNLTDSVCPGLIANGVRIERDLILSGSTFNGASQTQASASKTAAIWLSEAAVGGRLLCNATTIFTAADRGIQADRATFGGNIRFINGFSSNAEIRLIGVQVSGSIDLAGATISSLNDRALDLGEAVVAGSVFILESDLQKLRTEITGRIEMGHTRIGGRLTIRNSTLVAPPAGAGGHRYLNTLGPSRIAVWAPRLRVEGDVTFIGDCRIEGQIDMSLSEIGGSFIGDGQHFNNPNDSAVDLSSARVAGDVSIRSSSVDGSVSGSYPTIEGSLMFRDIEVGGSLRLSDCKLSSGAFVNLDKPDTRRRPLVNAPGSKIGCDLDLRGIVTQSGSIWFGGAEIHGDVGLDGAQLTNQGAHTASFGQATIGGSVLMRERVRPGLVSVPFRSFGLFALNHTKISGRVIFEKSLLEWSWQTPVTFNKYGAAFEAIEAVIGGGTALGWESVNGAVDFTGTTTPHLADRPTVWGDPIRVTGFRYDRFAPLTLDAAGTDGDWDVESRAKWLGKQSPLDTAPFEHAAHVMHSRGLHRQGEDLLIRGRRMQRQRVGADRPGRIPRPLDFAYEKLFGYGYRPARAAFALAVLFVLTIVPAYEAYHHGALLATDGNGHVFGSAGQIATDIDTDTPRISNRCGQGLVVCFQPWLFAADTIVPIIDLGQRSQWHPQDYQHLGTVYHYWFALMTALGWGFSAVSALTFSRLGRSSPA